MKKFENLGDIVQEIPFNGLIDQHETDLEETEEE